MKRSSPMPLYEAMVHRESVPSRTGPVDDPPESEEVLPRLVVGRSVRIPMGYLLLAAAGGIVLLLGVYMAGARRGERATQIEYERFLTGGGPAGSDLMARDPLALGATRGPNSIEDLAAGTVRGPTLAPAKAGGGAGRGHAAPLPDPRGWSPIESDPRQEGLHYLVLAETRPEGAVRLAAFCRDRGLEAYAVSRHNSRFSRVVAFPGFTTRSRSDPAVDGLVRRVLRIGLAWKEQHPGERDLSDAYFPP